jgi:acyl carrier protein
MNLDEFIENFALQFDDTPIEDIKAETIYENLDEWSSLIALSVIAMIDQEYGAGIGAKEIIESNTVEGLFNTVKYIKKQHG